jgi:hypothetical protein
LRGSGIVRLSVSDRVVVEGGRMYLTAGPRPGVRAYLRTTVIRCTVQGRLKVKGAPSYTNWHCYGATSVILVACFPVRLQLIHQIKQ